MDAATLTAALQRVDRRKVDEPGCVSFRGPAYAVGVGWMGQTVDVVYAPRKSPTEDGPADVSTVTIEAPGTAPRPAHPVEGRNADV